MTLEFFITSLVVVLMPGTGVLYTLAVGLGRGFRASALAAFGCTLGIVPHIAASMIGLAALLHTSAVAFQVVKILGVLYLLFMAWQMLRAGGTLNVEGTKSRANALKLVRDGILLNVLNPKLSLFFLAFLPQFVPTHTLNPTPLFLSLAAVFMAMTFFVFLIYGGCAALARDYVLSRPAVMTWARRSFAAAFGLLGARLALAER